MLQMPALCLFIQGFYFDSTKATKISKFPLRKLNGMEKYIDGDEEKFSRKYLISFFS
jgi:hypothetical protein